MTDTLTKIEVDDRIEMLTDGEHGADDVTEVRVVDVPAGDTRDGVAVWAVNVYVPTGMVSRRLTLKRFNHNAKAAAQSYAWDVADALGVPVA